MTKAERNGSVLQHGKYGIVMQDKSFITPTGKRISREKMKEILSAHKGMNRIHKPMGLLFYTDVLNGKGENWKI